MRTKNWKFLTLILLMVFIQSCKKGQLPSSNHDKAKDQTLSILVEYMSGYFDSANQSRVDSNYYDISLEMFPIWRDQKEYKWMYIEQAVSSNRAKPYRQRIYRLSALADGKFESRVYELPEPERFILSSDKKEIFQLIQASDLIERQGCSVYLSLKDGCFRGATKAQTCLSTMRGAAYASSIVEICSHSITSWDQGWNKEGEQVWGATKGAYIFDRK